MAKRSTKGYNINRGNSRVAPPSIGPTGNIENIIREAATANVLLYIFYSDSKGNGSAREVEPYEIKDDSLYAYCHNKNSIRKFKLSGISIARTTNKKFTPRWDIKI